MPDSPTIELEADMELLSEVSFPDARGGRRPSTPVQIAIARPLTEDDLATLATRTAPPQGQRLARIRHSHHLLAQCLARGAKDHEAAAITGYDPAYISAIKGDPAFEELLNHYAGIAGELFIDVMERMKALGLSTIDEITHRFESDPDAFSNRELMELAELMLVKPRRMEQASGAGAGAPAAPTININFVSPKQLGAGAGDAGDTPRAKLGVIDQ